MQTHRHRQLTYAHVITHGHAHKNAGTHMPTNTHIPVLIDITHTQTPRQTLTHAHSHTHMRSYPLMHPATCMCTQPPHDMSQRTTVFSLWHQWFSICQFVDVQPNDGFGTILPLEMLQLDVIFQPTKAKEYNFELVCKSEINR